MMKENELPSQNFNISFDYKSEAYNYELMPEPRDDNSIQKYRLINDEKFISFIWYDGNTWTADNIFDQEFINVIGNQIEAVKNNN